MAALGAFGFVVSACSTSGRATHPGTETADGEIRQFEKDVYGDWTVKKRYSEEQREQLEEYEDRRRSDEFDEWLSEGRD